MCLCEGVRMRTHVCVFVCVWYECCASQVLSIGHHQKFMYLSFSYLKKKGALLMSGIFDQTINYLVRGD